MEHANVVIALGLRCFANPAWPKAIGLPHSIGHGNGPANSSKKQPCTLYVDFVLHAPHSNQHHQMGLELHLGHDGQCCPIDKADCRGDRPLSGPVEDPDWEDIGVAPNYLRPPANDPCITIVDVTGVHFITVNYCSCLGSPPAHLQLLRQKLFPATIKSPRTCFTFGVLDDFIRDNLECGTSAMNYYSKIRRITSNVFPDAVPVGRFLNHVAFSFHIEQNRYRELLRVSRQWRILKMKKWGGFGHRAHTPVPGELALFCPTCPQPGINADPSPNDLAEYVPTKLRSAEISN